MTKQLDIFSSIVIVCACLFGYVSSQFSDIVPTIPYLQSETCGYVTPIEGDVRTLAPWSAAIFGRRSPRHPYEFQVTGTIISPTVIFTIYGGAYGKSSGGGKYFIPRAADHVVAAGIKTSNLDDADEHTQIIQVSHIVPWSGSSDQREYTYYVFHLRAPINVTTAYARDLCVPIFVKSVIAVLGQSGAGELHDYGRNVTVTQSGFSGREGKKVLKSIPSFSGSRDFCNMLYNEFYAGKPDHVYCGRNVDTGGPPVCLEPGSVAVIPTINNRITMVGITSLIPNNEDAQCRADTVYFYGRIVNQLATLDWLIGNMKCSPTRFACHDTRCIAKSKVCDQTPDCSNGEDEDPVYCRALNPCIFGDKTYECGVYGKCLSSNQICDGNVDCEDGRDERGLVCSKIRMMHSATGGHVKVKGKNVTVDQVECPPLQTSDGVEIKCDDETGQPVSCDNRAIHTVARQTCRKYYRSVYKSQSLTSKCQADGSWKPARSFGCEPECGILSYTGSGIRSLIHEGMRTSPDSFFPWHTAIFKEYKGAFHLICGGSLIERGGVITAAHCVTDNSGIPGMRSKFRVVLGATSSNFEAILKQGDAQILNISNIFVPGTFDRRTLQSDIAVIELNRPASFNDFVRPICYLNSELAFVPSDGSLGKVPGFGYTSDTISSGLSQTLQWTDFRVIPIDECQKKTEFPIPLSTFCGSGRDVNGNDTSAGICQGDSGGGFVFPDTRTGTYYLKGVVSHGGNSAQGPAMCSNGTFSVFTHVDAYADWILQQTEQFLT